MKEKIAKFVGKRGLIKTEKGIDVEVEVVDVKNTYGRDRYLVKPVAGSGHTWVENINLNEQE